MQRFYAKSRTESIIKLRNNLQHHNFYIGVLSQYSLKDEPSIFIVSDSEIKKRMKKQRQECV